MAGPSRGELDRLGERLRAGTKPEVADALLYDAYRASFEPTLVEVHASLWLLIPDASRTARLKTLESTVAKRKRGTARLSQIQDIAGLRFTFSNEASRSDALRAAQLLFPEHRLSDYRSTSQNGYRAIHVIVKAAEGRHVEIQLRTVIEDAWANLSENMASSVDVAVKYGGGPPDVRSELDALSELVQKFEEDPAAVLSEFKSRAERLNRRGTMG